MKWSWKLFEIAGIGIYVHWTFLILVFWFLGLPLLQGENVHAAVMQFVLVLALFACVVLHELGHALAARRYGIGTRDITILPIGGLARLERMPDDPRQELWVALAGPAVNVVIAAVLFTLLATLWNVPWSTQFELPQRMARAAVTGSGFLFTLMLANVFLVLFNMLPAFPMDGGRVLRALLAMRLDYIKATNIASVVGQFMAIVFGIVGLYMQNPFLIFIALFVFLGAQQEASMATMRYAMEGLPVRAAMMTRFRALSPGDSLQTAVEELLAGPQQDFPVVEHDQVVGLLLRRDLVRALQDGRVQSRVGDIMHRECHSVSETDMLEHVFAEMQETGCPVLPVLRGERLVGMITLENVGELLMLQTARRARQRVQ